jgi:hypothetical protein
MSIRSHWRRLIAAAYTVATFAALCYAFAAPATEGS